MMQIHLDVDTTLNREQLKYNESDNNLQYIKIDFYLGELCLIILVRDALLLINEFYRPNSASNCVALDIDLGCQFHKNESHAATFLRRAFSMSPTTSHQVLCEIVQEEMRIHGDCWPLFVFPYIQAWNIFVKVHYGAYSKIFFTSLCDLFAYCLLTENEGAGNLCAFRLREILQGKNWIDASLDGYAAILLAIWNCVNFVADTDTIACHDSFQSDSPFLALLKVNQLLRQEKYTESMSYFGAIFSSRYNSTFAQSHIVSLLTGLTVRTALTHLQSVQSQAIKLRQRLKYAAVEVREAKDFEEIDKIKDIAARLSVELCTMKENRRQFCQFIHRALYLSTNFLDTTVNTPVEVQWAMRFLVLTWNAAFSDHVVAQAGKAWCQFTSFSATHLLPSPLQALALVFILEHISAKKVPLGITLLTVQRPLFLSAPEVSLSAWNATETDPKCYTVEYIKETLKAIPNLPFSLLDALQTL